MTAPERPAARARSRAAVHMCAHGSAVGVVFSPGRQGVLVRPGRARARLEREGRSARPRAGGSSAASSSRITTFPTRSCTGRLKRVVRRATDADEERVRENREEAKRAMRVVPRGRSREPSSPSSRSPPRSCSTARGSSSPTAPRRRSRRAGSRRSSRSRLRGASSCARSARASRRGCAAATASAARSSAARASRRTSSRSRCGWRRIRICR